jgi:hypothetical protein
MRAWAIAAWVGLAIALGPGGTRAVEPEEEEETPPPEEMFAPAVDPAVVISDFAEFAGSVENATALVEGLRTGGDVVMVERDDSVVRFSSIAGPLGYGNVSVALSLAQANLAIYGIVEPDLQQIAAALAGGEVLVGGEVLHLPGVLNMRAWGMSWGSIAEELGFTLADAMRIASARDTKARMEIAAPRGPRGVEILDRSFPKDRSQLPRRPERPAKALK